MKRMFINPRQLNEIMSMDYNMPELKKVQRKIYKSVSDFCGKMHSDNAWQDVKELIGMINSVEGVEDVHVGAGEYTNYLNPENGAYRDYNTTVVTPFGKLYGYIRCHAAGTKDDIFKYYDMTISLYPDKKRDMEERLEEINEAMAVQGLVAPNLSSVANVYAKEANNNSANIRVADGPSDGKTIEIDNSGQGINTADLNAPGVNTNNVSNVRVNSTTTSVTESRYSKRQVELGRMLEMRKHGKIYSKKQLNEMFAGGAEIPSAEEIIKRTSVFKIFDAVLIAFGEEVKAEMDEMFESGEDMTQWIMNLLNEATPEQKNEFFSEIMR